MTSEVRPQAREGLLTSDHSKRGRRYLIVVDPSSMTTTLLEPWEHAVLILCDGTHTPTEITGVLSPAIEGEPVDARSVQRCLKFFERERLIDTAGLRRQPTLAAPGPRTLAGLQLAYREWHKDPVRTGQILSGLFPPPFPEPDGSVRAGLDPTVAVSREGEGKGSEPVGVGTTLFLAQASSLLDAPVSDGRDAGRDVRGSDAPRSDVPRSDVPRSDAPRSDAPRSEGASSRRRDVETMIGGLVEPSERFGGSLSAGAYSELSEALSTPAAFSDLDVIEEIEEIVQVADVADLLEAVDLDFREVESREAAGPPPLPKRPAPPPVGKATGGEARLPPEAREQARPAANILMSVEPEIGALAGADELRARAALEPPSRGARGAPPSEAALRPTMVAAPPADGREDLVQLLAPPRAPSDARGAVEGALPLEAVVVRARVDTYESTARVRAEPLEAHGRTEPAEARVRTEPLEPAVRVRVEAELSKARTVPAVRSTGDAPWDRDDELTARLPASIGRDAELAANAVVEELPLALHAQDAPTDDAIPLSPYGTEPYEETDRARPAHRPIARPRAKAPAGKLTAPPRAVPHAALAPEETIELDTRARRRRAPARGTGVIELPSPAREAFERLRRAGLKARVRDVRAEPEQPSRRRDEESARRFDEAFQSLSAGELDLALVHFRALHSSLPSSRRLAGFIEAIELAKGTDPAGASGARPASDPPKPRASSEEMLATFEGVLEEAVGYGRCPACFSMIDARNTKCFACGFAL